MAKIELSAIRKSFGDTEVLKGVDLSIHDGEFVSLVGPSGCGKSTLLRVIAGLEPQSSGEVKIGGVAVDHVRPSARNLAMVFQSYALYPHLSVFDNIAVPLRMKRLSALERAPLLGRLLPNRYRVERGIRADVERVASQLEISPLLTRKPGQLSGGQRQRVAVGRALVREPVGFLFDEPLSNLDAKLRVHMRAEIAQLHRRLKATFVYVTHDQAEAMTMSGRIAVMIGGELVQVGTPSDVYDNPRDIRVAEFIGSPKINVLPGAVQTDGRILMLDRVLAARAAASAGPCRVAIRPERLSLGGGDLSGVVVHIENMGAEAFVHLGCDGLTDPVVIRLDDPLRLPAIGSTQRFGFAPEAIRLFDAAGKRVAIRTEASVEMIREVAHV
ncbi:ABC transporter ATP-binding protein [Rhodopseudomonas palustris]|uniref:ABC transporter ATP-binding protein n=1 Tax=Rhodopseudomonas palustris TaxID=1076 RepID=UPI0021F37135|nr:ABC transporter ATP-binding protein [Rhodopseudomonas palustris]UYO53953.1 ABC transporter ATP-binding protein [Rhodopseudomonas palustris]